MDELWAVTDADGAFTIDKVQQGKYDIKVSILGYVDYKLSIDVKRDISNISFRLKESSLALDEVVVTAKRPKDGTGTSHDIGRDALNHLQLSNMTDMAALLPGGRTTNPDLTSSSTFSVRSSGSAAGNAAFSTAVEVDGVRMGNNAAFSELGGVDTRSISVDNVESVEVISGVPSDGRTPLRQDSYRGQPVLQCGFFLAASQRQVGYKQECLAQSRMGPCREASFLLHSLS